jgi:adenylate kinase
MTVSSARARSGEEDRMRITFFGSPGSGKGTQADMVSRFYGLKHVSTGMMLREEINNGSELGKRIRRIVESGHLVSDEVVNEQVFSIVRKIDDFLLDGYPRNLPQAESLDKYLMKINKPLSGAVFIQVPDEEVLRRLTERLVCACPDGTRHIDGQKEGDLCPACGEPLTRRTDDNNEVIRNRLHHYHNLTRYLEDYYENRLLEVNGMGTVDQVFQRIKEALGKWE